MRVSLTDWLMQVYFVHSNSWEPLPFVSQPKEQCPLSCLLRKVDQTERTGWEEHLIQAKSACAWIWFIWQILCQRPEEQLLEEPSGTRLLFLLLDRQKERWIRLVWYFLWPNLTQQSPFKEPNSLVLWGCHVPAPLLDSWKFWSFPWPRIPAQTHINFPNALW